MNKIIGMSLNEMANTRNKYAVIAVYETEFWRPDITKKAKVIEGVYLVNLKKPTYLCELSVSYPATFLRNYFHNVKRFNEDELAEMEKECGDPDVRYYHGTFKPDLIKYYKSGKEEDIIENEMCNPSYC